MNDEKWILAILKRELYHRAKSADKYLSASEVLTILAAIEADAVLGDRDTMAEQELPWK